MVFVFLICEEYFLEWCKNFCEECDKVVCLFCIFFDIYKKYVFLKIFKMFYVRKEIINNDIKELEEIVFFF